MIKKEELFQIGYFAKPHGIKGELSLCTDYHDLLEDIDEPYLICELDGIFVPFFVETYRYKGSSVILVKLENIVNELEAKRLSNKTVYCPLTMIKNNLTEEDTWRFFIGYSLEDEKLGMLGEIIDVDESTINTLFKIDYKGKELFVPMAEELIISVDEEDRRLVATLPEGLIDL